MKFEFNVSMTRLENRARKKQKKKEEEEEKDNLSDQVIFIWRSGQSTQFTAKKNTFTIYR